jgi:hypothetical protein
LLIAIAESSRYIVELPHIAPALTGPALWTQLQQPGATPHP